MKEWLLNIVSIPKIRVTDIIEIIILSFLIYHLILWIKNTKAWLLLKGLLAMAVFILAAYITGMHTILWIAEKAIGILATALIIVFQPELRRALERLGQKEFISSLMPLGQTHVEERFTDQTLESIVTACYEMGKVKTGALIVVEQTIRLSEYEATGIVIDGIISRALLINTFEINTPLHDGAVIIRGDRMLAATCYLPLTETILNKDLGTRHRAAVGASEVSDALVIVVSEETGAVSAAYKGNLEVNIKEERLEQLLRNIQGKTTDNSRFVFRKKQGGQNETQRQ